MRWGWDGGWGGFGGFGGSFFGDGRTDSGYCPPSQAYCGDPIGVGVGIGIGIGSGGGGGNGGNSGGAASDAGINPSGKPPLSGENLGIPNTLHIRIPSILQTLGLAPIDPACRFIPCGSSGFAAPTATVPFPQVVDWAAELLGAFGRLAGVVGVAGSVLMEQGDFDVRTARCNARYDAEKDACRAKYGSGGRFGRNRAVGACLDRAFYRYQACLRGQPDPAGPMARIDEASDAESSLCGLELSTTPLSASTWDEVMR